MFLFKNSTPNNTACLPSQQTVLMVLSLRGPLVRMRVCAVRGCMCVLPRLREQYSLKGHSLTLEGLK